jgi:hypothetical protein
MASHFIECPSCGWEGKVDDELVGHKIKCPKCKTSFTAEVGGTYDLDDPAQAQGSHRHSAPSAEPAHPDEPSAIEESSQSPGEEQKSWLEPWPQE